MSVILVIDCGTTNLRVTAVSEAGDVLSTVKADGGVRHTAIDGHNGRLRSALGECIASALAKCGAQAQDVAHCVAYGMITSNMGLLEIPHVAAPASVQSLRDAMRTARFEDIAPFPIAFIPGVRNFAGPVDMENFGAMDMVRGEETEAVGLYSLLAPKGEAVFVLPGSHNKFVRMGEAGEILGCMTSISGELLDAVTHHTILADAVNRSFVSEEAYDADMACEGAWACAKSGLGRAAFAGRILNTLGGKSAAQIQSYLLGVTLALDVQALWDFLPSRAADSPQAGAALGPAAALGVAPDVQEMVCPQIFVAGKPPVQQAMCDVMEALGMEGAKPVPQPVSARMGLCGALRIALAR